MASLGVWSCQSVLSLRTVSPCSQYARLLNVSLRVAFADKLISLPVFTSFVFL